MYNTGYFNNNNRYNPYYAPYIPYNQQSMQQPMQQVVQQPVVQQMNYEIPITNIRYLNEKEMDGYVIPVPNTKEMLIDRTAKVVCIKSTDQIGESRAKYYKFDEIVGGPATTQNKGNSEPKIDMSAYVKKEDIQSLTKQISDKLASLEGKIDGRTDKPEQSSNFKIS